MLLQIPFRAEFKATLIAFEWPLASVYSDVHLQVARGDVPVIDPGSWNLVGAA